MQFSGLLRLEISSNKGFGFRHDFLKAADILQGICGFQRKIRVRDYIRILENFTTEIATATYMLQQRLELLSYSGIAQKAACWLLIQARQSGKKQIRIPESVSNWAMVLNVSRSSLHRELKKLETDGIIKYSAPAIEIVNQIALQDVLNR